ncbi:MAG: hypothetical protein KatS3mg038_1038 [Candidatus Kapaibacterium sp.]|nr:MAG: hypothetical protein KatS3mg038_1038 [Candidatus Kapabacteria bacterium]
MERINTIRERIVECLRDTGLIKRIYGIVARNVEAADLPVAIVAPTQVTDAEEGSELALTTITYVITVLVHPADFGAEGENEASTIALARALLRHFRSRPGLETNSHPRGVVYNSVVSNRAPIQTISYGGQEYLGTQITLEVMDLQSFEYED